MRRTQPGYMLSGFLVLAFTLTFGFRECNSNKGGPPLTPQQVAERRVEKFASGIDFTEHRLTDCIAVARTLRLTGKASRAGNLRKAKLAKTVNDGIIEAIDFVTANDTLDGEGARKLHEQVSGIVDAAKRLEERGDSNPQNDAEIYFDLGVTIGKNELVSVFEDLGDSAPAGLNIPVTPAAKAKFKRARERALANGETLDAAIKELEGPPRE